MCALGRLSTCSPLVVLSQHVGVALGKKLVEPVVEGAQSLYVWGSPPPLAHHLEGLETYLLIEVFAFGLKSTINAIAIRSKIHVAQPTPPLNGVDAMHKLQCGVA